MGKILNGVANDFEFDMFPSNVEKVIITKENYSRLFKDLEIQIMDLKEQVEYQDLWRKEYLDRIDKAIECLETRVDSSKAGKYELLNILKGKE